MKNKIILAFSIIIALGLLAGCDSSTTESQTSTTSKNTSSVASTTVTSASSSTSKASSTKKNINTSDYTEIKFSEMYETKGNTKNVSMTLQNLDGKKVRIKGYPAVQSPLDESFLYLNNQPYVTCPFCTIGDVTKLEVIPIYMADGSKIPYVENGLDVYGTLEIGAKVDTEGYTTQFRIYADTYSIAESSEKDKAVQEYYQLLSDQGMIYDLQLLQMNIEYATNPEQMTYYGTTKEAIIKGIVAEYLGYDEEKVQSCGEGYTYLSYIEECPYIVKDNCEPSDANLKKLNDELIDLYNKQIEVLKKYQDICYKYNKDSLTSAEVDSAYNELVALNPENLELFNEFTTWNNKLRD